MLVDSKRAKPLFRRPAAAPTDSEGSKLASQLIALARDHAKSGGRTILTWIVALVALWWTIEVYVIDVERKLQSASDDLVNARAGLDRISEEPRKLNKQLNATNLKIRDLSQQSRRSAAEAEELANLRTEKLRLEKRLQAPELEKQREKAQEKLESAENTFESASKPELISFKPPVPGSEQFRMPYTVAPMAWSALLVGLFAYVCSLRWRTFQFAARVTAVGKTERKPDAVSETLAPAAWWMYPIPSVRGEADRGALRKMFAVGERAIDQYPALLLVAIAVLLTLHFRVDHLSQKVAGLVVPAPQSVDVERTDTRWRASGQSRNSSEITLAAGPLLSATLIALNVSLAIWWLWPRTVSRARDQPLEPGISRRAAGITLVFSSAIFAGTFVRQNRRPGDKVEQVVRRILARATILRKPRHRRHVNEHLSVELADGLYLNPRSNVIHLVSGGRLIGVGAQRTKHQRFKALSTAKALELMGGGTQVTHGARSAAGAKDAPISARLHGSIASYAAESTAAAQLDLGDANAALQVLLAGIRRDFEVKAASGDRTSSTGRRRKPRRGRGKVISVAAIPPAGVSAALFNEPPEKTTVSRAVPATPARARDSDLRLSSRLYGRFDKVSSRHGISKLTARFKEFLKSKRLDAWYEQYLQERKRRWRV
ncbi:MAG: hypothetical protein IV094_19265 [Vitreoscilla sp.]|nr:hypothetical protein [Vitreoscilla sp.]